jgi:glutamine cyclotransferase
LIVSDGSANLHFWDKDTYQEIPNSRLRVEDGFGNAVRHLNELEYAYGYVWANIWLADDIVQIDPQTGKVVAFYNFASLYPSSKRMNVDQVLNGIAFDPVEDVFYLTGKWWPEYYKVKICGVGPKEKDAGVCGAANPQGGGGDR